MHLYSYFKSATIKRIRLVEKKKIGQTYVDLYVTETTLNQLYLSLCEWFEAARKNIDRMLF